MGPGSTPPAASAAGSGAGGRRTVALVGATGSIGTSALDVVARHSDRLRLVAAAADTRWRELCATALRFGVEAVALRDAEAAAQAAARLAGSGITVLAGPEGVERVASWPSAAVTLAAPTGVAGLRPVLAALRAGKDVALANKESLVAGGRLVTAAATASGARLLPVDSEHSAIFQCLRGRGAAGVRRLWLTASGGPFRDWPLARLAAATPAQALAHPTWRMGPRITVDSATLFNKGLEVVEASWLFGVGSDAIEVLVHRQSIVHSLVQFVDGSLLAQCGVPDMRLPILAALSFPERWPWPEAPALDLAAAGRLDFEAPDLRRFPCLDLARAAARRGGTAPAVANAADEVAVARFLAGEIGFADIPHVLDDALSAHMVREDDRLEGILEADAEARRRAALWRATAGMTAPMGPPGRGPAAGGATHGPGPGPAAPPAEAGRGARTDGEPDDGVASGSPDPGTVIAYGPGTPPSADREVAAGCAAAGPRSPAGSGEPETASASPARPADRAPGKGGSPA